MNPLLYEENIFLGHEKYLSLSTTILSTLLLESYKVTGFLESIKSKGMMNFPLYSIAFIEATMTTMTDDANYR